MFDLVYPLNPVPVIPRPKIGFASPLKSHEEVFPVIEPSGLVIGEATRSYCHGGSRLLHPVVHLHLVNSSMEICLQKRSARKDLYPGLWDTAVGGHVSFGESIEETLYREAGEEIGLSCFNPFWLETYVYESEKERECVSVVASVGDFDLSPDEDEVDEVRWWSLDEIEKNLGKSLFTPNFEDEFGRIRSRLFALL